MYHVFPLLCSHLDNKTVKFEYKVGIVSMEGVARRFYKNYLKIIYPWLILKNKKFNYHMYHKGLIQNFPKKIKNSYLGIFFNSKQLLLNVAIFFEIAVLYAWTKFTFFWDTPYLTRRYWYLMLLCVSVH